MRELVNATEKTVALPPVRPNEGLRARYRRQIERLIASMHNATVRAIRSTWNANPPEMEMAADALPARDLADAIRRVGDDWRQRFEDVAPLVGRYFAIKIAERVDGSLESALKASGFSVRFKMSREVRDVLAATMEEQVGLIRSIPSRYFEQIEGYVMRAAAAGRDLDSIVERIGPLVNLARIRMGRRPGESDVSLFARTMRRAELIARDQSNKATATIRKARETSLGIQYGKWLHSGGGKEPRPEHVKMNGKRFKIAEGMWDPVEKKRIMPGELINCRCTWRSIIPGLSA